MHQLVISGIRPSFPGLSQSQGQITHVLLTRSPLEYPASWAFPFDLHVLSTPPAFVLSQDQTLHEKTLKPKSFNTIRKAKPDKNNPKNWQKLYRHPTYGIHQMPTKQCHKKMASNKQPIHYRVLKEHTPTGTTPHGALTCELCSFWCRPPVSGATLPTYQTLSAARNSVSWSELSVSGNPQNPCRRITQPTTDSPGRPEQKPVSLPLSASRPAGAAPCRSDPKKVTQFHRQIQIARSPLRGVGVCAGRGRVAGTLMVRDRRLRPADSSVICAIDPRLLDSHRTLMGSYRRSPPFLA